jgi:hypothetical protein
MPIADNSPLLPENGKSQLSSDREAAGPGPNVATSMLARGLAGVLPTPSGVLFETKEGRKLSTSDDNLSRSGSRDGVF